MKKYAANFPNCGYIVNEFSQKELAPIWNEVNKIQHNFNKSETIDHSFTSTVKKEYKIIDSLAHLESLILPFTQIYNHNFEFNQPDTRYSLTSAWVNFQEAGEFFSPHTHVGEFSFALYMQVPFLIEDEKLHLSTTDKKIEATAGFLFYYNSALGEIRPQYIAVDKSWENSMIFFPGSMLHSVQPFFTSKEYRITISGNLVRT